MNGCNWQEMSHSVGSCLRPGGTALTERALEICTLAPGARIADIGCGAGATLELLHRFGDFELHGVDPSEALLAEAATKVSSATFVQAHAESLPFADDSFDALFCECVLSIVPARSAALAELARVVKPGGFLVVSDLFAPDSLAEAASESKGPLGKEVIEILKEHGFTLRLWEDHKQMLKEFLVRLILADERPPEKWCGWGKAGKSRSAMSYILVVVRKTDGQVEHG